MNITSSYIVSPSFHSLHAEFDEVSTERIEEWYVEVVDRWTWDTGSAEDRALLERLDVERHYRRRHENAFDIEDELAKVMAEEIRKEIDAEILKALMAEE